MYALIDDNGHYLNHSTLGTMSTGAEDMAWTTEDREKAELMQDKAEAKGTSLEIVELW